MIIMKISVIIASYNYAQYIEEAINSVISQSYQDWEMVIVDDGSSDNSVEIIKSYCEKDNRIRLFQHADGQNKGLKETLLLGIENACGEWIAFLESDDSFAPDNLAKKVEIIQKYPEVKLIFNKIKFLDENNERKNIKKEDFVKQQQKLSKMKFPKNMFYDFYINNMILTFSCVMVETRTLKETDFNTPVDAMLDWWLWVHLAYKNSFYYLDQELTDWRLHTKSYIKTSKKPILHLVQVLAYNDVYKRIGKPIKLLLFMFYSSVKLFFIRGYRYLKKQF